ncbi:MAG: hypothetical protein Q3980_09840 [Turicibacter sp.]|nr:hypothetical protein [Turicibacter sp.]
MNAVEILELLGWEVLRYNNRDLLYSVRYSEARMRRESIESNKTIRVRLTDCHFENGNLYILFEDAKTNEFVDNYWHNNMDDGELYLDEEELDNDFEDEDLDRDDEEELAPSRLFLFRR